MPATTANRLRRVVVVASVCAAACCVPAFGQEAGEPTARTVIPEPPAPPDIVVRGRAYGELRLQIRLAEEAVFARFNEINSTDDFDIHCRDEPVIGSRVQKRACFSNSWREQNANIAQAVIAQARRDYGPSPQFFLGQQLLMQRRLAEEAQRLALEDEQLGEAVLNLGRAKLALARRTDQEERLTAWRQVSAGANGLPYEAARMFEVRVGEETWAHLLTQRTFAFASVTGDIRSLALDCREEDENLDYEPDVEWTLPADWSSCILLVRAKKGTTFALLEF
jgi:hypothetical protein